MSARPAGPDSLQGSRRRGVSRFLKQARSDLLPRDDIGRVLVMPSDAVIKLRPLRVCQRYCVRFQTFPYCVQQFLLLSRREAVYLLSQITHTPTTLARFSR